jgi:hypothetical protein
MNLINNVEIHDNEQDTCYHNNYSQKRVDKKVKLSL